MVTVKTKTKTAKKGLKALFTGVVYPKAKGRKVTVSCKSAKGTAKTTSAGAFRIRVKLASSARQTCVAKVAGDDVTAAGASKRVTLK